jgi:hypothetical protein
LCYARAGATASFTGADSLYEDLTLPLSRERRSPSPICTRHVRAGRRLQHGSQPPAHVARRACRTCSAMHFVRVSTESRGTSTIV